MARDLRARCAAFGWELCPMGRDRWELRGNGSPAEFSSTAALEVWLAHQERGRDVRDVVVEQLRLELELAA